MTTTGPFHSRRRPLPAFLALLGLGLLFAAPAFGQDSSQGGAVTVNLVMNADVGDQQVFVLRHAARPAPGESLGPPEQIQMCGGVEFPGATQVQSDEPCQAGRTYVAEIDVDPESVIALQLAAMDLSRMGSNDPDDGFHIVMQTFEGEMPQSDEDFTVTAGATHWVWVAEALAP